MTNYICECCGESVSHPLQHLSDESHYNCTLKAKRDEKGYRFDILDPEFLRSLARIADFGARKYGEYNWHKSRMVGHADPCNHILDHLTKYKLNKPFDHATLGEHRKMHLAAIAFNAMMEYWYESQESQESI